MVTPTTSNCQVCQYNEAKVTESTNKDAKEAITEERKDILHLVGPQWVPEFRGDVGNIGGPGRPGRKRVWGKTKSLPKPTRKRSDKQKAARNKCKVASMMRKASFQERSIDFCKRARDSLNYIISNNSDEGVEKKMFDKNCMDNEEQENNRKKIIINKKGQQAQEHGQKRKNHFKTAGKNRMRQNVEKESAILSKEFKDSPPKNKKKEKNINKTNKIDANSKTCDYEKNKTKNKHGLVKIETHDMHKVETEKVDFNHCKPR